MMYEVEAKFGHVGKNQYVIKIIPVIAASGSDAAAYVRKMPRVKHHHPDAIRQVRVVDAPRYWELVELHEADPYFQCRSIQEQRVMCPDLELLPECRDEHSETKMREVSKRDFFVGKQRIRNPRKYLNNYYYREECAA
jgi:hypothetical protein